MAEGALVTEVPRPPCLEKMAFTEAIRGISAWGVLRRDICGPGRAAAALSQDFREACRHHADSV